MKRYMTLMVIPHNDDHVREFNMAVPLMWGIGCVFFLFVAAASYFAYGYYDRAGAELQYANLMRENPELDTHLETLTLRFGILSERVGDLSQADARIRAYARKSSPISGNLQSATDEDGYGAEAPSPEYAASDGYASLDQLSREAQLLKTSLESIYASVSEKAEERRYIPSIFPVAGDGWYSSYFGYRTDPITRLRSFNEGIDIAGRKGTPIIATADGIVDAAKYHQRYGHMVSIDHANGLRTVYAHLEDHDLVRPGQKVTRGQKIGKMDRSGRTTAVHLHYAVRQNNKARDPLAFILDANERNTLF